MDCKSVFRVILIHTARSFPLHVEEPEEERRIFYVAVTRAADRLLMTGVRTAGPSRFLPAPPVQRAVTHTYRR